MKLLNSILPILLVASVSGQSEDYDEARGGLRGSQDDRQLYWDTNVGNGGNARTGDAFGPFGVTGNAVGGNGGSGNVAISRGGWRRPWSRRWCRHHWCHGHHHPYPYPYPYPPRYYGGSTNVGNGGNARTGNAYGPYGTTGNAYGGHGGNGNVAVNDWGW